MALGILFYGVWVGFWPLRVRGRCVGSCVVATVLRRGKPSASALVQYVCGLVAAVYIYRSSEHCHYACGLVAAVYIYRSSEH